MMGRTQRKNFGIALMLWSGLLLGCSPTSVQNNSSQKETPSEKSGSDAKEVLLPGGLRFIEMKIGEGDELKAKGRGIVHYSGYLSDGTPFDSSYDRNKPFEVNLRGGVIQGWLQGLPGMKVGGKRKLVIPPALGYGAAARPKIPANSTLVFEIKLLQVLE